MLRKLISLHYLGFYACLIFSGLCSTGLNNWQWLGITMAVTLANLIGVSQGYKDCIDVLKSRDSHE